VTQTMAPTAPPALRTGSSGARTGALLAVASGVSIVVNYAFLLAAGRIVRAACLESGL